MFVKLLNFYDTVKGGCRGTAGLRCKATPDRAGNPQRRQLLGSFHAAGLFTASVEDRELVISAAAGAYGVILKDMALEILVQSLRQVADGQRLLPLPPSDQAVFREQRNIAITENVLTVLTGRERQIMRLVSEGVVEEGNWAPA